MVIRVSTEEDLIDLVAEVYRSEMLKAMIERPDAAEREAKSEEFARDTINLINTFLTGESNAVSNTLN